AAGGLASAVARTVRLAGPGGLPGAGARAGPAGRIARTAWRTVVIVIAGMGRLGLDHVGRPTVDGGALDGALDQFLDGVQQLYFRPVNQRHGRAGAAGAAGAADAVHVVFRHVGQLEIHDVRQMVEID